MAKYLADEDPQKLLNGFGQIPREMLKNPTEVRPLGHRTINTYRRKFEYTSIILDGKSRRKVYSNEYPVLLAQLENMQKAKAKRTYGPSATKYVEERKENG